MSAGSAWFVCIIVLSSRFGPYFVEPIVVGLDPVSNAPFVGGMDLIGSTLESEEFVVAGSCTEQLYGMCETLWEKDMVCLRFWGFIYANFIIEIG